MATTKYISLENLQKALDEVKARVVLQEAGKGLSTNDFTNELKSKYDTAASKVDALEATGGQANVIEKIKVNGQEQSVTPGDKSVDISVPTTVSQLTNDSGYLTSSTGVTKEEMAAQVSSVYKPGGSVTFDSLPELAENVLGKVYNVTDGFVTTDDFTEGAGKSYPAGTNVVVIESDSDVFKFDVLSGFVDLTPYAKTSEVDSKLSSYTNTEGMNSAIATAKQQAVSEAGTATDGKLANYVKTADLVAATEEEITAMFAGWAAE